MAVSETKLKAIARKLVDKNPELVATAKMNLSAKEERAEAVGEGRGYPTFWDEIVDKSAGTFRSRVSGVVSFWLATDAPPTFSASDENMLEMYTTLEARRRAR